MDCSVWVSVYTCTSLSMLCMDQFQHCPACPCSTLLYLRCTVQHTLTVCHLVVSFTPPAVSFTTSAVSPHPHLVRLGPPAEDHPDNCHQFCRKENPNCRKESPNYKYPYITLNTIIKCNKTFPFTFSLSGVEVRQSSYYWKRQTIYLLSWWPQTSASQEFLPDWKAQRSPEHCCEMETGHAASGELAWRPPQSLPSPTFSSRPVLWSLGDV